MTEDTQDFTAIRYVPVLKWKRGEARALKELESSVKAACSPVIEVVPIPFDHKKGINRKSLTSHLDAAIEMLKDAWGATPAWVDLRLLPPALAVGNTLTALLDSARQEGLNTIPVVSTASPPDVLQAAAAAHKKDGHGIGLRERADDFLAVRYASTIKSTLQVLQVTPGDVDLILDLQEVSATKLGVLAAATTVLVGKIPDLQKWRTFTLTSTAFPINLSGIAPGVHTIARADWALWNGLSGLPRFPSYGDYAVSHWDIQELDPRVIKISASIRYTATQEWIIFRGKNVAAHGFGQFTALSKQLVKHAAFSGSQFSAGDAYVTACAAGGHTGNHETWRRVATNHHITFVVRQLATKAASSIPRAPGSTAASP